MPSSYHYDPITGEYVEGEEPGAAVAALPPAPDPKASFAQVGTTGDQNRDNMIQSFMRGMQERSVLLNKDPAEVLDTMLDKVGPGKMMLTNMLHGAGAALLNQPFKTVRESLFERLMEQQKINIQKQQNDTLRLQQFMQMDSKEKMADTAADAKVTVEEIKQTGQNTRLDKTLSLRERELELKAEKLAQDYDLDWAKVSETTRHNLAAEGADVRKIILDEAIHQFEKDHPKASGGMTEAQKISATARISGMYDKSVAPAENIISSYNRIASSVATGAKTGIMDFNLIYSYVKILDDASAVREGEVGFIERAQGIKQKLLNLPRRPDGKILADDTVKDIINQANAVVESFRASTDRERQRYLSLAKKYDLEVDLISDPFENKAADPLGPSPASSNEVIMVKDPKTGRWVPQQ